VLTKDVVHKTFLDPCLPFITNASPTDSEPRYLAGANLCSSGVGSHLERRPGFSQTLEPTATAFTFPSGETVEEIFTWRRWGSTFITMATTTTSSSAKVYAYRAGIDTGFALLYTATATDGNPFSFCVANNTCFMGNGTQADNKAYDGTLRNWGITKPSSAPSVTTGTTGSTFNVYRSKKYCYTYGNSSIANESSPSLVSNCAGPATNINAIFTVTASTDSQVDQIRVYATTDGGSADPQDMREITGSPFANTTQVITDATLDTALGARTAPAINRNDPPPGMMGIRYLENSSRIVGFSNGTVYYSGFEEIANGVPYECFPSGTDGNQWPTGNEVTGIAEVEDGVVIFCPDRLLKVTGDSLDTFRRYVLARRQGARNYQCIAALGSFVVWLDTADTIWILNGEEIGEPIRPSLSGIDHTRAQMCIHIEGIRRWLLLLDGANGLIYPFDLDRGEWNVPWPTTATALHSGETALGTYTLLSALSGNRRIMQQVEGSFNDGGTAYSGYVQSGMIDVSPPSHPDLRAAMWSLDIKRNQTTTLSSVKVLTDDDPTQGTYTAITVNREDQPTVIQGSYVKQERYTAAPTISVARQVSVRMDIPATDAEFELYYYDIGMTPCV
jgi:hypothetical protein